MDLVHHRILFTLILFLLFIVRENLIKNLDSVFKPTKFLLKWLIIVLCLASSSTSYTKLLLLLYVVVDLLNVLTIFDDVVELSF
jgi:hypothetical protein